jgi:hypothetical protein
MPEPIRLERWLALPGHSSAAPDPATGRRKTAYLNHEWDELSAVPKLAPERRLRASEVMLRLPEQGVVAVGRYALSHQFYNTALYF